MRQILDVVADRLGPEAAEEAIRRSGDPRGLVLMTRASTWHSYDEFRAIAEAASAVLGGPEHLTDFWLASTRSPGSNPSFLSMVHRLRDPDALYATNTGRLPMSTIVGLESRKVRDREWVLTYRLDDGFEAFPELCAYITAINGVIPSIFGFPLTSLVEEECVRHGDPACVVRITWGDTDPEITIATLENRIANMERAELAFRASVGHLVADEPLETVLERIVTAAAESVWARAFVLALDPLPWATKPIYTHGISVEEATTFVDEVLGPNEKDATTNTAIVHVVASSKRRFGRLAVLGLRAITGEEQAAVAAYAQLAATALDSAVALEESRRQAATARVLLELSSTLSVITSSAEMAERIALAVPDVLDCDIAAVVLINDGVGTIEGLTGVTDEATVALRSTPMRIATDGMAGGEVIFRPEQVREPTRSLLRSAGVVAARSTPVFVDGLPVGALVIAVKDHAERLAVTPDLQTRIDGLVGQVASTIRNTKLLDQVRHQALHDPLTGLANRALVLDRVEHALARARRTGAPLAAFFVDLDGFKDVNDSQGHAAGDHVLRAAALRLSEVVRGSDTVGRLGGDEFIVLAEGDSLSNGVEVLGQRLLAAFDRPFGIPGCDVRVPVTASIGVAVGDRTDAHELLRDADTAMYRSKTGGKNQVTVFAPAMQLAVHDRITAEADLRRAVVNEELFLDYQPTFELATGRITGAEALLRWRHPTRGVVAPNDFLPILERTGDISAVGRWVLRDACCRAAEWHRSGFPIDVSVNVSARQLDSDEVVGDVRYALVASGLPSRALVIEITETTLMKDPTATAHRLSILKDLGLRLAVDDFGTGYSSLAYLRQFPVDALKIDRSFVEGLGRSPEAGALLHTLLELGRALGLETHAEGIEEQAQLDILTLEKCDSAQGFLLGRPMSPEQLRVRLQAQPAAV